LHIKSAIPHPLILGKNFFISNWITFANLYQIQFINGVVDILLTRFWSKKSNFLNFSLMKNW
jgi:hypothetical protein